MHIEFLLEEPSSEEALRNLLPKIIGTDITYSLHAHQGKRDLLNKLRGRFKGYRRCITEDFKIVVLIDQDREDCKNLKERLEKDAEAAGLITRTASQGRNYQVLNRIAIEELEAWFFGDVSAIVKAFPNVNPNFARKVNYRDPDNISGGTWEALERVLQRAGYFKGGLEKIKTARIISSYMDPSNNNSQSFIKFKDGLLELVS